MPNYLAPRRHAAPAAQAHVKWFVRQGKRPCSQTSFSSGSQDSVPQHAAAYDTRGNHSFVGVERVLSLTIFIAVHPVEKQQPFSFEVDLNSSAVFHRDTQARVVRHASACGETRKRVWCKLTKGSLVRAQVMLEEVLDSCSSLFRRDTQRVLRRLEEVLVSRQLFRSADTQRVWRRRMQSCSRELQPRGSPRFVLSFIPLRHAARVMQADARCLPKLQPRGSPRFVLTSDPQRHDTQRAWRRRTKTLCAKK